MDMFMNIKLSQREEQEIAYLPLQLILQIRRSRTLNRYYYLLQEFSYNANQKSVDVYLDSHPELLLLTNTQFVKIFNDWLKSAHQPDQEKRLNELLKSIWGIASEPIIKEIKIQTRKQNKRDNKICHVYFA